MTRDASDVGTATTQVSFPTYADLTQTQGWAHAASAPVRGALEHRTQLEDDSLQRYTEGALLGVGGMGKVVLAHDRRIGREVAVKQLHTERELTPEERARFMREARVQGQLEHPSIVPVYDIDERSDGTAFFTMRRVLGRTLQAIIEDLRAGDGAARHRFTLRELLQAFATVCLTIDYAHSRGVIHRDIKPANIMLGDFGEVYVLDWGLARLVDDERADIAKEEGGRLSMTGEMMGTPLYMAPEQMHSPDVTPAADVFSLGAILFELLTLERLRDARTLYLPAEARPSVRTPQLDIAPELEAICVRATQTEPAERFPSARALQEAVARYLEGDRDMARRRELAQVAAREAETAFARAQLGGPDEERDRGKAMKALAHAISLDPANRNLAATLARMLGTPPAELPAEVQRQLRDSEDAILRAGARFSIYAILIWFLFLPLVYAMGVREPLQLVAVIVPAAMAAALGALATRYEHVPMTIQVGIVACTLGGMVAISRLFGPLMLMPTMIAVFTMVIQVHPRRQFRLWVWGLGSLAMVAPVALEALGILPSSYRFEDGLFSIVPQMIDFPPEKSIALLLVAGLASMVVPTLFIGRIRIALTDAQTQLMLRHWQQRRLVDEITEVA